MSKPEIHPEFEAYLDSDQCVQDTLEYLQRQVDDAARQNSELEAAIVKLTASLGALKTSLFVTGAIAIIAAVAS
jgi:hypothetical protein